MDDNPERPPPTDALGELAAATAVVSPNRSACAMTAPPPMAPLENSPASSPRSIPLASPKQSDGRLMSEGAYMDYLKTIQRKAPLEEACNMLAIRYPTRANLEWFRHALIRHWYPAVVRQPEPGNSDSEESPSIPIDPVLLNNNSAPSFTVMQVLPSDANNTVSPGDLDIPDDESIIREHSSLENIFGAVDNCALDDDGLDEDEEDDNDDVAFKRYQTSVRVAAAERTEKNRRPGGQKTQKSIVKSWNIFQQIALEKHLIRDGIVDEHSLLLFIEHSANRCKRDRRGEDMPGTRVGASQLKKEFFGALRIRKVQEASDPTLALRRPAHTVHVYDAIKTRMDEALHNFRDGLIPAEDAPDIVANTFLAQLSDKTMDEIHRGFLDHRELKPCINGHLAWTLMHASGNRGDDVRALRLCEMQPYTFLHPDGHTQVFSILGLQSDMERKAKRKAMSTQVNPTYSCFIAHQNPEMCPLGAFALLLHYLLDVADIEAKYEIDFTFNKSWREIRLIHGSAAKVPYHETALQALFVHAYKKAGVKHRLKAHLARHMLGYKQEKMGVNSDETTKLGWSRDTYLNTYAPAIPKTAVLGAHGYKKHETYDPPWTHIPVPEEFLSLVCPKAEENIARIKASGREELVGAVNFLELVITLRPYLFRVAGAIYQNSPQSVLFRRLPALSNPAVRKWMSETYPVKLREVEATVRPHVDLERLQNEIVQMALEQLRSESTSHSKAFSKLDDKFESLMGLLARRTQQFTPPKAPRLADNGTTLNAASNVVKALDFGCLATPPRAIPPNPTSSDLLYDQGNPFVDAETRAVEDTGVYEASDTTLRGFVVPSPRAPHLARPHTDVDLVLPPLAAFASPGDVIPIMYPFFGQRSVQWADVFGQVKQPVALWNVWKPAKSLNDMTVRDVWDCYNVGEAQPEGVAPGMKPPLRLVEQHFRAEWRKGNARKFWQRFRVIPEWIDSRISDGGLTVDQALEELEKMRSVPGKTQLLGTFALSTLLEDQRKAAAATAISQPSSSPEGTPCPDEESASISEGSAKKRKRAAAVAMRAKPKKAKTTA